MKLPLFFICVLVLLFSCNEKKMDARAYLESAKSFYTKADYDSAQKMLDSLKVLYPKDFRALKDGLQLSRLVEIKQQNRNLVIYDSLLQVRKIEQDSMKSDFIFEKNPDYNDVGKYHQKSQKLENNLQRSYIRSEVDELGDMRIASVYYGGHSIHHTGLKVSNSQGDYTQTESIPYDGGMNYSFTDLKATTEVVTYSNGKDNGVILFIYNNAKLPLKAEYTGGKKYSIMISPSDKEALVKTFDYSVVLSDIDKLNKEKEKASKRMAYLQGKVAN